MRNSDDSSIVKGIGDDAAILQPTSGYQLVVTTDTLVEGVHFIKHAPAYMVGYKLMATNLSDIASMGATPKWATLNLSLASVNETWLQEFSKGFFKCADQHHVTLIGGDITRTTTLCMSVQLMGEIPDHQALRRNNAQCGDNIYITGTIGKAAQAYSILQQHDGNHDALTQQHIMALYQPTSRVSLAIELRDIAHSAIDISDGVFHELDILCRHSNTGAHIEVDNIPVVDEKTRNEALIFGEDYELLFTADKSSNEKIIALAERYDCAITKIGKITQAPTIKLFSKGEEVPFPISSGFDHFQ